MTNGQTTIQPLAGKQKRRSRHKRDATNLPPLELTERDMAILQSVGAFQLLFSKQIQLLFFRSLHKTRKRLFRLWEHGLLERRFPPIRPGEGSRQVLYTLASKGARLLGTIGGLTDKAGQRASLKAPFNRKASPLFYEHTLCRNDFRLALSLAGRQAPHVKMLFWKQDRSIKDAVTFLNGNDKSHAPAVLRKVPLFADGFFALEVKDRKLFFFVEIDRGTTDNNRFLTKMKGYYHLWLQKRHIQRYGIDNFRVLIVTTSSGRMENLLQTTKKVRQGNGGSGLFWFTTFDRYDIESPLSVLGAIWRRASAANGSDYSILD